MSMLDEAREILTRLGFDKGRTNERSGRTLLALAQLNEDSSWSDARNPMIGVRAILDWLREELAFPVAENTRETYRRQTLHQFVDGGLVVYNADDPGRPTNSSLNNYMLNDAVLEVLKLYGTDGFDEAVDAYLSEVPTGCFRNLGSWISRNSRRPRIWFRSGAFCLVWSLLRQLEWSAGRCRRGNEYDQ